MIDNVATVIEQRLGASTARLHARIVELVMGARRASAQLRAIVVAVTCGHYHDFVSDSVFPKGDLIEALREVRRDDSMHGVGPATQMAIDRLIVEIIEGRFNETADEGRRWADRVVTITARTAKYKHPPPAEPPAIDVTDRDLVVLTWLVNYGDRSTTGPTLGEVATGCRLSLSSVSASLSRLEARGAAVRVTDNRWLALRRP